MNRFLAYVATLAIFLLIFLLVAEAGLRLIGVSPQPTINEFHPKLGWVKKKNISSRRNTSEFDVTYSINALGLRDDEDLTLKKPKNVKRILFLGDSFTLGYTVDREDLFVDILEKTFSQEDRKLKIQIINAGTEGYSNDQELIWLWEEGWKFKPDMVIMNFYENDIFWNSQDHYQRFPKPLLNMEGTARLPADFSLKDPGEQGWFMGSTACGKFFSGFSTEIPTFKTDAGATLYKEMCVLLKTKPDFMVKALAHTMAIMKGFKESCREKGVMPLVALIPSKAQIYTSFKTELGKNLRLSEEEWNPNLPLTRMRDICKDVGLDVIDPTALFMSEAEKKVRLYYEKDRHFSPEGNRAFAKVLYNHLTQDRYLGQPNSAPGEIMITAQGDGESAGKVSGVGFPLWLVVVLCLWGFLGIMYCVNYNDENSILSFLKVGALIWCVVGIITLLNGLSALLGDHGGLVFGLLFLAIILFLLWKLGKRAGLILELYMAFTHRGHWYMMPLLAVMLAIGSLLIVAASSPFVAPFIYTLF